VCSPRWGRFFICGAEAIRIVIDIILLLLLALVVVIGL
jgi:hypothetical protein